MMDWDEFLHAARATSHESQPATPAGLDAFEERLGTRLPRRYREFALACGAGWLARAPRPRGLLVRLPMPAEPAVAEPGGLTLDALNQMHGGFGSAIPKNKEGKSYSRMLYFARDERPGGAGRWHSTPYFYGWDLDEVTDRPRLDRAIYRRRLIRRRHDWDRLEWVAPNFERFVLDYCLGGLLTSWEAAGRPGDCTPVAFAPDRGGPSPRPSPAPALPPARPDPGRTEVGLLRRVERPPAPVAESWRRIEAWLAAHCPAVLDRLLPGATDAEVDSFEKLIGQPLPDDLRASVQIHDGMSDRGPGRLATAFRGEEEAQAYYEPPVVGTLLYEYRLDSIGLQPAIDRTSVRDRWRRWFSSRAADAAEDGIQDTYQFCTSFPHGAIRPRDRCRGWIPLTNDGGNESNHIGVDLDPGPTGIRGQVINFGRDEPAKVVLAKSWAQFLEDYADELEAGNFRIEKSETRDYSGGYRGLRMGGPLNERASGTFGREQWARAKLPAGFLATPVASPRLFAADARTAAKCRAAVEGFLIAAEDWRARWCATFRIAELGFRGLSVRLDGVGSFSCGPPSEFTDQGLPVPPVVAFMYSAASDDAAAKDRFLAQVPAREHADAAGRELNAVYARYATKWARAYRRWAAKPNDYVHVSSSPLHDREDDRVVAVFRRDERSAYAHCARQGWGCKRYLLKLEGGKWRVELCQFEFRDKDRIETHAI